MEFLTNLKDTDASHEVYEDALPPANVPHPFYYLGEWSMTDDCQKREIMQGVSLTVHVWHDKKYDKASVFRMLETIGAVFRAIEKSGTHSYKWMINSSGMRVMNDTVSSAKTVYVHGIYEITMTQIGSK